MGQSEQIEKMKASCYFGGEYFLLTKEIEVQGRPIIRLPPRRGDIKRQIFASMAHSLAEYLLLIEEAEVQGKPFIRLPPRRGEIKRQIFASMAESLAELVRGMSKRAQKLNKLNYNQIVLFLSKICLCSKSGSRTTLEAALNQLKHVGIQN